MQQQQQQNLIQNPAGSFHSLQNLNIGEMQIHQLNSGKSLIAFLGTTDPFFNFYFANFTFEDERFNCVEQCFVTKRLRQLQLQGMADEVKRFIHKDDNQPNSARWPDSHPRELKWYGAEGLERADPYIRSKLTTSMERKSIELMVEQKFRQNEHLKTLLKATNEMLIAEACPDRRWGVGYKKHEKDT